MLRKEKEIFTRMEVNNIGKDPPHQQQQQQTKQSVDRQAVNPHPVEQGIILRGWICGRCGRSWSPLVKQCLVCNPPDVILNNMRYKFGE